MPVALVIQVSSELAAYCRLPVAGYRLAELSALKNFVFIKYLVYAQSECDETIVHLDFLFETQMNFAIK